MRTKLIPAALAALFVLPWSVHGQTTTVTQDVEVRSGPTDKYYPTLRLKQGDQVTVLPSAKEQPGWLAIKPPPSSFSWINAKYVKQLNAREGFVDPADAASPVEVYPGSALVNQQPNMVSMKLDRGTIVVIVDKMLEAGGEKWLPIAPHPSEFRYIPASAVQPITQVVSAGPPNWTLANPGAPNDPLISDAEAALRAGNLTLAKQKLQEAGRSTDQATRVYATNRLASLNPNNTLAGHPNQQTANPLVGRPVSSAATSTSLSPSAPPLMPNGPITMMAAQWSSYGTLRSTALQADGQPLYRLESNTGQPLAYVTTRPGKTLRAYVGKVICVYGPTVYRGDGAVRMQYIVASDLNAP
jgi:uncharacterized protein YgiM (DUF1202 family)